MRSLVVVNKWSQSTKRVEKQVGKSQKAENRQVNGSGEETISYYVSSLVPQRAERFGQLIRGHWGGCEIRNHWVRDELFEEDATRSKDLNVNGNLAVLRCALIALKSTHAAHHSWPVIFEHSAMKPNLPFQLLSGKAFK